MPSGRPTRWSSSQNLPPPSSAPALQDRDRLEVIRISLKPYPNQDYQFDWSMVDRGQIIPPILLSLDSLLSKLTLFIHQAVQFHNTGGNKKQQKG